MDIWRSSMDELHGRLLWTTLPFTEDFTDCGVLVHVDSLLRWFFVQTALITMDDPLDEQELGSFFCFPIMNEIPLKPKDDQNNPKT